MIYNLTHFLSVGMFILGNIFFKFKQTSTSPSSDSLLSNFPIPSYLLHPDSNPPIVTSQSPVPMSSPPSTSSPSLPQPPVSQTPTAVTSPTISLPSKRSSRATKPPIWLSDYVHSIPSTKLAPHSIHHVIQYSHLSLLIKLFLSTFSNSIEPTSYGEAILDDRWVQSMKQEIDALVLNKTWEIVDLPAGKKPIGCKWVYKIKYNADGSIERFKARLVAKGYTQQEGIDFHDTFSPVAKMVTVRCALSLAAMHNWPVFQMDVFNAFLQGDLHEEVFMVLPQGFGSKGEISKVCRLKKSLYGLKQASRQWNIKLTTALVESGFQQSKHDYSLFTKKVDQKIVMILVYVDDLIITGNDLQLIKESKIILQKNFKIKDLGELRYFLGIEFLRSSKGILMTQRKYILELILEWGLAGAKPAITPLEQRMKFTISYYDKHLRKQDDND